MSDRRIQLEDEVEGQLPFFNAPSIPRARTITAAYVVKSDDVLLRCNLAGGAFTVTLPPAEEALKERKHPLYVKKIETSANNITLSCSGSDTIEGAATLVFGTGARSSRVLVPRSGGWDVVAQV